MLDVFFFFFFLRIRLMGLGKPVLLVGNTGCGKTMMIRDKLMNEEYLVQLITFNHNTDSALFQAVLEKRLEKKAGRTYSPPGNKDLIVFIDDLNMPRVDRFGTQSPHTILRQYFDYSHWYDRTKLTIREVSR
jgi:dynein heavy chain